MRLRQLFENETKVAAFALGRMNPATIGHERLVNAIKSQPGDHFLFLTDRPAKLPDNPLSAEEKLDWARKSFDGISVQLANNIGVAAHKLWKQGYTQITFLEGEDKLFKILQAYNGKTEGKKGPIEFPYDFEKINYVQLERDQGEDAKGMSGTKLRSFVLNNDLPKFKSGVTVKAQPYAEDMFKKLQGLMGVDPVEEAQVQELNLFKKANNASVKEQDPNKLKVLDWIAAREDGKEHFLSFYRKGAAWSGKLLFIRPEDAKRFMYKVEDNEEYLPQIKKALTSIATTGKLFDNLGIKYQIRNAE